MSFHLGNLRLTLRRSESVASIEVDHRSDEMAQDWRCQGSLAQASSYVVISWSLKHGRKDDSNAPVPLYHAGTVLPPRGKR
jgi:hypothetical protein